MSNSLVSLQSVNLPDRYVRHRNFLGEITPIANALDRADSLFFMVPGLADSNAVSFRSFNFERGYLRHSDFRLRMDLRPTGPDHLFDADATFWWESGLGDVAAASFRSYNFPTRYIRHRDFALWVEEGGGELFERDATFRIVPAATHRFLPWVRRGIAAGVPTGSAGGGVRAAVDVALHVEKTLGAQDVGARLYLYGPGDALGIDARQVLRTDPPPRTSEFPPNYLVSVEFDSPELPWMLSPDASPDPAALEGKLRPWLCLVVIRADRAEIDLASRPLPRLCLRGAAAAELPNLAEAWAWAQAEVTGATGSVADAPPEATLSRLLSPRRLDARTRYVACVVPTFLAGVRAGLGDAPVKTDAPAWLWPPPDLIELPVYYSWEFGTAEAGDFEELVRRLVVGDLPGTVGVEPLDLSAPGGELPAAPVLGFEGALRSPSMRPTPWKDPSKRDFQAALRTLLDKPSGAAETLVAPPLYGAEEVGLDALPAAGAEPVWLEQLNLDPRHRAAAGLGARVVERDQEQLVASAWEQLGELERANQLLRQAQLARSLAASILERRLEPLAPEAVLGVTEPGHSRVPTSAGGGPTVRGQVEASKFPQAAITPTFRRALRSQGPVAGRLPGPGASDPALLEALASGDIEVPIGDPDGLVKRSEVGLHKDELSRERAAGWRSIDEFKRGRVAFERTAAVREPQAAIMLQRPIDDDFPHEVPADHDEDVERLARLGYIIHNFRDASQEHQEYLASAPRAPASPAAAASADPLPVGELRDALVGRGGKLDPERTVVVDAAARVDRPPQAPPPPDDQLAPIAAAPRFPQAMYEPLQRELPEALMPGAGDVPPETVGALIGNASFIEAYMAGLNRALHDELFWRGFPVDRSSTAFQWFWDARGAEAGSGPAPVPDIPQISDWWPDRPLGANAQRVGGKDMVVLMIRGELVRRFPGAPIYAVAAGPGRTLGLAPLYPEFRGTLGPDILFAGFALPLDQARGSGSEEDGYFFVIQEPPTGTRFGLDAVPEAGPPRGWAGKPATWDELSWSDLVPSAEALAQLANIAVSAPANPKLLQVDSEGARWGRSAGDMARVTFQRPVRVAIHAWRLLAYATGIGERVQYVHHGEDRIEAIGGVRPDGDVWRVDEETAIGLTERGEHRFHVEQPAGDRVEVTVARRRGRPYLKTVADGDIPNNLLKLPPFPA